MLDIPTGLRNPAMRSPSASRRHPQWDAPNRAHPTGRTRRPNRRRLMRDHLPPCDRPPSPRIKAAYRACPLSRFLLRPCRPLLFSSFHFLLPILSRQGIFLAAASNGPGGPFLLRCKKPEGTHPASLQAFVFLPAGDQICLPVSRSVNTAS